MKTRHSKYSFALSRNNP